MTNADAIANSLLQYGVKTVFGIPGQVIAPLVTSLGKHKIKFVLTRHEQNAVHAAAGYARATGKIGVALVISGPGILNAITGLVNSYYDCIPLICIVGEISNKTRKLSFYQNINIKDNLTKNINAYFKIKHNSNVYDVFHKAFNLSMNNKKGPVVISIGSDTQQELHKGHMPINNSFSGKASKFTNIIKINILKYMIKSSKKTLLYFGSGACDYETLHIEKIIQTLKCPCVMTMGALGLSKIIPSELNLGMRGDYKYSKYSFDENNEENQFDLIIYIGARIDKRIIQKNKRIIFIKHLIDCSFFPQLGIIRASIDELAIACNNLITSPQKYNFEIKKIIQPKVRQFIDPFCFFHKLYETIPPNYIITSEIGQHTVWAAESYIRYGCNNNFFISETLGAMGSGLPLALGAVIAEKYGGGVTIAGDGSLQLILGELNTVIESDLNIKIVVFNNQGLGRIRNLQHLYANDFYYGVDYTSNFDYSKYASACHIGYYKAIDNGEFEIGLKKMFSTKKTFLLELVIDKDIPTFNNW